VGIVELPLLLRSVCIHLPAAICHNRRIRSPSCPQEYSAPASRNTTHLRSAMRVPATGGLLDTFARRWRRADRVARIAINSMREPCRNRETPDGGVASASGPTICRPLRPAVLEMCFGLDRHPDLRRWCSSLQAAGVPDAESRRLGMKAKRKDIDHRSLGPTFENRLTGYGDLGAVSWRKPLRRRI